MDTTSSANGPLRYLHASTLRRDSSRVREASYVPTLNISRMSAMKTASVQRSATYMMAAQTCGGSHGLMTLPSPGPGQAEPMYEPLAGVHGQTESMNATARAQGASA